MKIRVQALIMAILSHFQIFLRVAEETGVDAEPVLQAESPHRRQQSAGQRMERQQAEEPETGMHQHSDTYSIFVFIPHSVSKTNQNISPIVTICFHTAVRKEKAS